MAASTASPGRHDAPLLQGRHNILIQDSIGTVNTLRKNYREKSKEYWRIEDMRMENEDIKQRFNEVQAAEAAGETRVGNGHHEGATSTDVGAGGKGARKHSSGTAAGLLRIHLSTAYTPNAFVVQPPQSASLHGCQGKALASRPNPRTCLDRLESRQPQPPPQQPDAADPRRVRKLMDSLDSPEDRIARHRGAAYEDCLGRRIVQIPSGRLSAKEEAASIAAGAAAAPAADWPSLGGLLKRQTSLRANAAVAAASRALELAQADAEVERIARGVQVGVVAEVEGSLLSQLDRGRALSCSDLTSTPSPMTRRGSSFAGKMTLGDTPLAPTRRLANGTSHEDVMAAAIKRWSGHEGSELARRSLQVSLSGNEKLSTASIVSAPSSSATTPCPLATVSEDYGDRAAEARGTADAEGDDGAPEAAGSAAATGIGTYRRMSSMLRAGHAPPLVKRLSSSYDGNKVGLHEPHKGAAAAAPPSPHPKSPAPSPKPPQSHKDARAAALASSWDSPAALSAAAGAACRASRRNSSPAPAPARRAISGAAAAAAAAAAATSAASAAGNGKANDSKMLFDKLAAYDDTAFTVQTTAAVAAAASDGVHSLSAPLPRLISRPDGLAAATFLFASPTDTSRASGPPAPWEASQVKPQPPSQGQNSNLIKQVLSKAAAVRQDSNLAPSNMAAS